MISMRCPDSQPTSRTRKRNHTQADQVENPTTLKHQGSAANKTVAMAANRLYIVVELCLLQYFSQAPDMYINGAFFKKYIGAPNMVQQL